MKIPVNAQETRRDKQEQNSERGQIEHIDQKWKKKEEKIFIPLPNYIFQH
jgi:arginine deiminase